MVHGDGKTLIGWPLALVLVEILVLLQLGQFILFQCDVFKYVVIFLLLCPSPPSILVVMKDDALIPAVILAVAFLETGPGAIKD